MTPGKDRFALHAEQLAASCLPLVARPARCSRMPSYGPMRGTRLPNARPRGGKRTRTGATDGRRPRSQAQTAAVESLPAVAAVFEVAYVRSSR